MEPAGWGVLLGLQALLQVWWAVVGVVRCCTLSVVVNCRAPGGQEGGQAYGAAGCCCFLRTRQHCHVAGAPTRPAGGRGG